MFNQNIKCLNASIPRTTKEGLKLWPKTPNGLFKMAYTFSDAKDDNIVTVIIHFENHWHMGLYNGTDMPY